MTEVAGSIIVTGTTANISTALRFIDGATNQPLLTAEAEFYRQQVQNTLSGQTQDLQN